MILQQRGAPILSIDYRKGDLLQATDVDVIIHGCNCQRVWGAGIARQIRNKWPDVYERYLDMTHLIKGKALLGNSYVVRNKNGPDIVAAHTQLNYGRGRRQVNYAALANALWDFKHGYFSDVNNVYAMPMIGCGLAGGDWNIVSKIVEDLPYDVRVYQL